MSSDRHPDYVSARADYPATADIAIIRRADGRTLRKSCDRCHQQKLRCVGDKASLTRCKRCQRAGLECVYGARSSKKTSQCSVETFVSWESWPADAAIPTLDDPVGELDTMFGLELTHFEDVFPLSPSSRPSTGGRSAAFGDPNSSAFEQNSEALVSSAPNMPLLPSGGSSKACDGLVSELSEPSAELTKAFQELEATFLGTAEDHTNRGTQDYPVGEALSALSNFLAVLKLSNAEEAGIHRTSQSSHDAHLRSKRASIEAQGYVLSVKLLTSLLERMLQSLLASPSPSPTASANSSSPDSSQDAINLRTSLGALGSKFADASHVPYSLRLGDLFVPPDHFGNALNSSLDLLRIGYSRLSEMEDLLGIPSTQSGQSKSSLACLERLGLTQPTVPDNGVSRPSLPARFVASIWEDETGINKRSSDSMAILTILRETSSCTFLAIVFLGFLIYSVVKYTYRLWFHPLARYPGPLLARASSYWATSHARQLRKAHAIQQAHERYGPVVRVGPNELSFASPTALKDIYGHGQGLPKAEFYKAGKFTTEDSVFSIRDRAQHAGRRSLMAKTYSQAHVWTYAPLLREKISQTLDQLHERSQSGSEAVNVYPWLHFLALDVVFHFSLNHESGTLRTGEAHPVIRELEAFQAAFAWTALFPPLRSFGRFLPWVSVSEPFTLLNEWIEFCVNIVQRERNSDKRSAVMTSLIEKPDAWLKRKLTDVEVAEELLAIMIAGSGTSANTIVFLIWAVVRHPGVYKKLKAEVYERIPHPRDVPDITAANKFPYTNAVIMEALRRYPTIPGGQPRVAVDNGLVVDGNQIPKGTIVGVQNYSIHQDPNVFPDPDSFLPERWLGEDTSRQRAAFNGFGTGSRACIGRNLAMMELQLVVPSFFRRFDVTIAPTTADSDMIMTDGFSGGPMSTLAIGGFW
ncbi:uncharacterized protein PV07_02976 [Cladophialophora immunda]|uniref:Zn(2)-C6 fungal-type domain-containing protein n=1 Tax=Cladophialophora immunda TaxID=569365 RepID=A0A0D2D6H8_9EURO|nr:uncharacterized protein PV07_02976 [Cladophialophora immunda]KIW31319.1 hypothetical protein PV07_02976 [Cladophialophora immunda]